ncbi:iron-sulfur cluster biosynthesis family protein [Fictibacillus aquaticus]|uniref:Core domain-containing protein n=1 Tax=Fictibacillus aquaticus TaxID=2021314 RepID=A0A235FBQ2_9BACL|nr:iron-sulfur cluster biosynthesis family protein [Fictibacillus aquaticus]OYD58377.1 hypothetical protein CGZ90_00275 [Fictibacillus aquaticus]
MNIKWSGKAREAVNEWLDKKDGVLKLKYDTEGCGCLVSGISALWLVPEPEENDVLAEGADPEIYYDKTTAVFFDENLLIDTNTSGSFVLKSESQILNSRMKLFSSAQ